ncbi:MAG: 1,2-phenylacetyl-CoA epoxidase subunit B [Herminiimonas sp.]|nr:1,2-phenylacetyl-CoA epoxidase subunit B [Herminiimonas sp.]
MNQPAWPLWEVFIRSKQGLEHKHCGSLHATDSKQALQMARDVYTRRQEGVSIWVVPSNAITASAPDDKEALFDPAGDKIYRHPSFYALPPEVEHM